MHLQILAAKWQPFCLGLNVNILPYIVGKETYKISQYMGHVMLGQLMFWVAPERFWSYNAWLKWLFLNPIMI